MNKQCSKRYLALLLAFVMLIGIMPTNIFAAGELELAPAKVPTGVKNAEGDIPSENIANDAPNAVHAFVGVQTGGDANLKLDKATGQEFQPIQGVKAYFQWFEDGGYVSPVYSAISDAKGRLNIDCKPYVASDGKIIKFDADPTVSGGHEKYRFWVDHSTIPAEYQLQYITGEQVVFPPGIATITQGGSGSDTPKNTHENWKILLMQKPKAEMHKKAEATQEEANGGYIKGKVSWDYNSPSGGVQWKYIAHQSTPAKGVTVKASYLSDYAMKKIYSQEMATKLSLSGPSAIRDRKWTSKLEGQLQDEIKKQMKGEEDKWIAETVTAVTNAEGDYTLQFNGTWGYKQNADVAKGYDEVAGKFGWTQEALDRLGTVATKASDGSFKDAALNYNEKHINLDWLFVSTEGTEDLRVMTPYNNNWYTVMNSDWGIHSGWSGASAAKEFSVGVTNIANRSMKSDFVFGINKVNFNITNYDSRANTAIPGDVAETSTTGLPYSNTSDKYRIVWYDQDGNEVPNSSGPAQQPSSTGTIPSAPLDTSKLNITQTTEFTAKLYRVDSKGNNAELIAIDSFTVEVSHLFISRYDDVSIANPKAGDKEMAGAKYSATGLPEDLTIDSSNGTISGKAKEAGLYKATFTTILSDKDAGEIKGTRDRNIAVTDSPLAAGEVGKAYSQAVKPVPEKDPKDRNYIYKVKSVNFISGKEVAGLKVEGNATTGFKIAGTPTAEVKATEDVGAGLLGPNVEVTYDIYKTNDAGKEILVAENHVDKVPLVVTKAKDNSLYEPAYKPVDGKVGEAATVAAPTFTDADGKPATPENVTYELGKDAPTGAQVNADGSVTYTPVEADADKAVKIPVVVKYSDGTTDNVNAVINVTKSATTADKVKELGGLNPQAIKVWKGDKFDWKDGVTPKNIKNENEVWALIEEAEVTDITVPERNSSKAGKFEGKLKFTFNDGSSIEVPNQMLIVSDHVVVIDPNNTDKDAPKEKDLPSDKIEVRFVASTGVKEIKTTGKTFVKPGTIFEDKDFPQVIYEDDYKGPVTWTPADEKITKTSSYYDKPRGFFKFTASATLEEIIDRTGNEGKPTPDGYVRVTFTKGEGVNDIANNKVYDVKIGTKLTADKYPTVTAKDGYENPEWSTPAGTPITADNATITATATQKTTDNTKDEVVPYLPNEDEPTTGSDGKDIPADYITVTFKSEDATKGTVKVGEKTGAEVKAKVKPGTNLAGKAEAVAKEGYGFTVWAPELGVAADKAEYTAKFIKSGDEVKANDPIPEGWFRVTVKQDATSIQAGTVTEKTYAVKPNDKLAADKFPSLTGKEAQGYENPAWYVDGTKVDTPADKAIKAETTFIAKAATPAEQTAKPVITAPKAGDKTITGTSEPNAKVVVELPDGTKVNATADKDGNWTANVPAGKEPKENDVIKAVATVDGKTPSEEATVTVGPEDPTPEDKKTKVTGNVKPVDPTKDPQDTGIKVENPDNDTKVTAKDEDGKDIPVEIDKDGKVIVTPGTGVDGPITVTITDPDLPNGKKDITVPVNGHEAGRDDNGSGPIIPTPTPEPLPIPDYNLWWPIYFAPTKAEAKPAPVLEVHEAYIKGYPDGTVRPNGNITRAEVATIFARLTQKNTLAQFIAQYSDVKVNDWFADSVMKLSSKGILTGYPDGTFKPNRNITRAEFANIVSKYIKNPKDANETFVDVPMNHWAKNAIAMVKAEGWITGYPDGTFRPDAPITRAEAVSIVNRMFDRAADTNFVNVHDYEIKSFTDLNGSHWAYYEIMEAAHTHDYERLGVRNERWDRVFK